MDHIEAIEMLNTHFFNDTTKCREAWYFIRAELAERGRLQQPAPQHSQKAICPNCKKDFAYNGIYCPQCCETF